MAKGVPRLARSKERRRRGPGGLDSTRPLRLASPEPFRWHNNRPRGSTAVETPSPPRPCAAPTPTVLLGREALGLVGHQARIGLAGLVPLRLAHGPAARRQRGPGLRGPRDHARPLQRHGVVRGPPGRVGRPLREVCDGDAHVARRGRRRLPVPALLPRCNDAGPAVTSSVPSMSKYEHNCWTPFRAQPGRRRGRRPQQSPRRGNHWRES